MPPTKVIAMAHLKTGIKEFNEIVPGLPTPSAILVQGKPGAGKTIFSLSLMDTKAKPVESKPEKAKEKPKDKGKEEAKDKPEPEELKPVKAHGAPKKIIVLTNNTPAEIDEEMTSLKIGFEAMPIDCYSWLSGGKAAVDSLANLSKITFLIEDALEPGSIVLFDSLTPLMLYSSDEEIQRFMQQLVAIAKAKQSIILFTMDLGTYPSDAESTFRSLCDGVIHLDAEKGMRILKMRDTPVPAKDFFYELGDKGLRLRSK